VTINLIFNKKIIEIYYFLYNKRFYKTPFAIIMQSYKYFSKKPLQADATKSRIRMLCYKLVSETFERQSLLTNNESEKCILCSVIYVLHIFFNWLRERRKKKKKKKNPMVTLLMCIIKRQLMVKSCKLLSDPAFVLLTRVFIYAHLWD
jgi:hypothetical protein